jgi:hypothetical protein
MRILASVENVGQKAAFGSRLRKRFRSALLVREDYDLYFIDKSTMVILEISWKKGTKHHSRRASPVFGRGMKRKTYQKRSRP